MRKWLFKKLFKRERHALIRHIDSLGGAVRRRNFTIAHLRSHNEQLQKQTREYIEVLQLKLHGIRRKKVVCKECGCVNYVEFYDPPRDPRDVETNCGCFDSKDGKFHIVCELHKDRND